jgi:diguanylate cyclase (GGDEF)-like protein
VPPFRSLSARLVVSIVATAILTFTTFVGLVLLRADRGLAEQTSQVARLSKEKLTERLDGDARLARSRILIMLDDVSRRLATVAQRADIVRAVVSGNTVAISEILRPALLSANVDGVIVVDARSRVLGAHDLSVDILKANDSLQRSALSAAIARVIEANDREHRRGIRQKVRLDHLTGAAIGAASEDGLADVMVEPIFDDFGDVVAVLIGHYRLKADEPTLAEFFNLTGRSIAVLSNGVWVSGAGMRPAALLGLRQEDRAELSDPLYVSQCIELWSDALTCAVASASELEQLTNQLVEIGEGQTRSLMVWLLLLGAASVFAFIVTCLLISRQITSPLVQITRAVAAGAKGQWNVPVIGTKRGDEVGDIARAVDVFKKNAIELLSKKAELERVNLHLDVALNNMTHGLCMFGSDERLIICNERYGAMYGLPAALTRPGTPLQAILDHSAENGHGAAGDRTHSVQRPASNQSDANTLTQELANGRIIAVSHQPMEGGAWVAVHEDITERTRAAEEITRLARTDGLTGLPNRTVFRQALERALTFAGPTKFVAVMCLDLDHFKTVNDTLGHAVGDALLKAVAERLQQCTPAGGIVSRLGGDEFAIVQVGISSRDDVTRLATRLVEMVSEPYWLDGHEIVLGTSIGIGMAPRDGSDPGALLKCADMALYRAKADGRLTFRFFEPEMKTELQARRELELDLHKAFANNEFRLFYQPLVSLESNRVCAFEALLRWQHPDRGFVPPNEFIPVAEEIGLIVPLTEWVLREACAEACKWPEDIKVAVNLSPVQFKRRHPLEPVINAIAATGLPAHRLEVEITESLFLQEEKSTVAALHELRAFGVRVAMDDFGTGYSSLSYLRSFPFDKIKIDRSFTRGMMDGEDGAIVELVTSLGRKLKMSTVAEGVETEEQLQLLRQLGCTEAQGFLFSQAVPSSNVAEVIARCSLELQAAA